jgi:hypothetical protein
VHSTLESFFSASDVRNNEVSTPEFVTETIPSMATFRKRRPLGPMGRASLKIFRRSSMGSLGKRVNLVRNPRTSTHCAIASLVFSPMAMSVAVLCMVVRKFSGVGRCCAEKVEVGVVS